MQFHCHILLDPHYVYCYSSGIIDVSLLMRAVCASTMSYVSMLAPLCCLPNMLVTLLFYLHSRTFVHRFYVKGTVEEKMYQLLHPEGEEGLCTDRCVCVRACMRVCVSGMCACVRACMSMCLCVSVCLSVCVYTHQ